MGLGLGLGLGLGSWLGLILTRTRTLPLTCHGGSYLKSAWLGSAEAAAPRSCATAGSAPRGASLKARDTSSSRDPPAAAAAPARSEAPSAAAAVPSFAAAAAPVPGPVLEPTTAGGAPRSEQGAEEAGVYGSYELSVSYGWSVS